MHIRKHLLYGEVYVTGAVRDEILGNVAELLGKLHNISLIKARRLVHFSPLPRLFRIMSIFMSHIGLLSHVSDVWEYHKNLNFDFSEKF